MFVNIFKFQLNDREGGGVILHRRVGPFENDFEFLFFLHLLLTVGPFESDALLVPQHCHFYHEHNQCDTYKKWGDWATADCQAKDMRIDSFSMLLDCDIDRFAGVEYVCCPKEKSKSSIISPVRQCLPSVCTGDGMHSLSCKQIVIRKQKINR